MLSTPFSPRKVAGSSIMAEYCWADLPIAIMQSQQLLTIELPLMFRTQMQCGRNMFCLERRRKVQLLINIATQPSHFLWCKANQCWCSVDAYLQDIEPMLLQQVLPREASDSVVMA
jgi:hypothetical protein